MKKILIIDGYVDEPTCLGVPPYISVYPRLIYGALKLYNPEIKIDYITIDDYRNIIKDLKEYEILIIISSVQVPGHYLSGAPITILEIKSIFEKFKGLKVLCGDIIYGYSITGGRKVKNINDIIKNIDIKIQSDNVHNIEKIIFDKNFNESFEEYEKKYLFGASVVLQHPFYPDVICEIETYRGCKREKHCSFCLSGNNQKIYEREVEDVIKEIEVLNNEYKIRSFRLGKQSCFFSYKSRTDNGKNILNPKEIEKLYTGIKKNTHNLETLHIDNVNPYFVAADKENAGKIAEIIAEYNTEGDVAALGIESFDNKVIESNNLNANRENVNQTLEIIQNYGAKRYNNGIYKLLCGINILFGLKGETKPTYNINYENLLKIYESGYLIRRINIRQVINFNAEEKIKVNKRLFRKFKEDVKKNIEINMIQKVFPIGTIIKNLYVEKITGDYSLARQLASYPILCIIPYRLNIREKIESAVVINFNAKSLIVLPIPMDINNITEKMLSKIKGFSLKKARNFIMERPVKDMEKIEKYFTKDIFKELKKWIIIK